jgi:hypothetical protein
LKKKFLTKCHSEVSEIVDALMLVGLVSTQVSTIFHPANRPINFLKSFLFGFLKINSVRVAVRVGVGFGLVGLLDGK